MYQIKLNDEDQKRLIKIIRQMMIKEDISVAEMAERLGCSKQYIYNYMSGTKTNHRTYKFLQAALCDELGITVGDRR